MAKFHNFSLIGISKKEANQYLLTFELNGQKKEIIARISMETPIFGVNFSDEFFLMRNTIPKDSRRIVNIIRKIHDGSKIDLPIIFAANSKLPELKAA